MASYFKRTHSYFEQSTSKLNQSNSTFNRSNSYFSDTPSIDDKISELEQDLTSQGVDVPEATPRSTLQRVFDVLGLGTYSVSNALIASNKYLREKNKKQGTTPQLNPDATSNADLYTGGSNTTIFNDPQYRKTVFNALLEGLKASNPFGKGNPEAAKTFSDVFSDEGSWKPHVNKNGNWKVLDANNILRFGASTTLDTITSPFSFLNTGLGSILRGSGAGLKAAGKAGAKATMRDASEAAYKAGVNALKNGEAENILRNFGQEATQGNVDDLIKATQRAAKMEKTGRGFSIGVGDKNRLTFVSDAALRKIGDKTIAPYVNQALAKIGDPLSKSSIVTKFINPLARETARNNPIEYAKVEARKMLQNDNIKKYRDMQNLFSKNAIAMFDGIDENTQHLMSQLMEEKNYMKTMKDVIEGDYKISFTKDAQDLYDQILTKRKEVEGIINDYDNLKLSKDQLDKYQKLDDYLSTYTSSIEQGYAKMLENTKHLQNVANLGDVHDINDFFNQFTNKNVSEIADELKKQGFSNAKEASFEVRHILDTIQKSVPIDESRKYFTGMKFANVANKMQYGRPHTKAEDFPTLSADDLDRKMADVYSQEQYFEKNYGTPDYTKEQVDKLLDGYGIDREAYNEYVGKQIESQAFGKSKWDEIQNAGVKRLEQKEINKSIGNERKNLIDRLLNIYSKDLPNDKMLKTNKNNIFVNLSKKSNEELQVLLDNEHGQGFGKSELDNIGQWQNETQPTRQGKEYAGNLPDLEGKPVSHGGRKYFSNQNNGFLPANENVNFKNLKDSSTINPDTGKPFTLEDNFAKDLHGDIKQDLQYEWNIGGTKIYAPVGKDVDVKSVQILHGLNNILDSIGNGNRNYRKIKNALRQMTIYLTDIGGNTDAISGGKSVIFGNVKHDVEKDVFPHESAHILQKFVKDLIYKEDGNPIWKGVMDKETLKMFPNAKYFNSRLVAEDNAASFAEFIKNPAAFSREHPERFKGVMDMLDNVTVKYDATLDKNLASNSFTMPELSRVSLQREIENLKPKVAELDQKLIDGGTTLEDAVTQKENYDKLIEQEGNNVLFDKLFHDTNGPDAFKTEITPTQIEVVKKYIDDDTPIRQMMESRFGVSKQADDMTKLIKERMEFVANEFERMGRAENIEGMRSNYAPHMKVYKEIPEDKLAELKAKMAASGKEFDPRNVHDIERKYNMTIDQFNDMVKQSFGVDFNVWENKLGELYLRRGIDSNRMLFMKKDYENIVKNLGMEYADPKDVPTGTKLFASHEDIKNIINEKVKVNKTLDVEQLKKDWNIPKEFDDDWARPLIPIDKRVFDELKRADSNFKAFSTSEYVAQMLNKTGQVQADETMNPLVKAIDGFLQIWKTNVTALNPGFHMSNYMSNQFNMYLSVGAKALDPQVQMLGALSLSKDEAKLSSKFIDVGGKKMSLADVKRLAVKHGVLEDNRIFNEASAIAGQSNPLNDLAKKLTLDRSTTKAQKAAQLLNFASPLTSKFAKKGSAFRQEWLPYTVSRKVGGAVENQGRMTAFIAHLMNGEGASEAAHNTIKFLFDYGDLTDFEKNVMKRIVPFYTWMRKNIPLQVEQLFKQPEKYKIASSISNNINQMTAPQNRVADKDKNKFAQDYIQLPYNTINPDTHNAEPTFLNPRMPYMDLSKLTADPTDIFKTIVSSSNPMIKLPYELTTNLNTFFNTPISRGIGDKREAPGYIQLADKLSKALQGKKQDEPVKIDARLRYILQNAGLLENISKIINADGTRTKSQPLTERDMALSSLLFGLKPYSYDVEKYKTWAYKDRLKQLRDLANSLE
jgi:hypothetical protein